MPQYPVYTAGQKATAAMLTLGEPQFVAKTANTDLVSNAVLANDPDLQFPVVANGVYLVEFSLNFGGTATEQIKTGWAAPAGATGNKVGYGIASGQAANSFADGVSSRWGVYPFAGTSVYTCVRSGITNLQGAMESGVVTVGSTAGTVALQWSQNTSTANTMRMAAGSWGRCTRIS